LALLVNAAETDDASTGSNHLHTMKENLNFTRGVSRVIRKAIRCEVFIFFLCFLSVAAVASEPPEGWKSVVSDAEQAKRLWEDCCEGEIFYSSRLLGVFRTMGSQHDGDRQYEVFQLLAQVPADPSDGLRHYLASPDPYDRAFAIQVIAHLGDKRFLKALEALMEDAASTRSWDILPYKTVGEGALRAVDQIRRGEGHVEKSGAVPAWLQKARTWTG
jgi:hypothetical protein